MIRGAAAGDATQQQAFAQRYAEPIAAYLRARWQASPLAQDVDDAVQEVFVECCRENGVLERASESKTAAGGFRGYLYGVARNVALRFEQRRGRRRERQPPEGLRIMLRDDPDVDSSVTIVRSEPATAGRYQVLGEIARGGMGVVLKGRDTDLGRDVAMKVLREEHLSHPAMVRRFVEEAQIAGQLQHPGVLPVYELGVRADRRPFFSMKLVKGRTLAALLDERADAASDRPRFIRIFESACQTIAYAHSRGVVHRDLKPSNILVGAFGEVQVVDWGLAKVLSRDGAGDDRDQTRTHDETVVQTVRSDAPGAQSLAGSVMGTPAYMSPEQARGEIDLIDERVDVFALGGILCEILTGRPVFDGAAREMLADAAAGRTDAAIARLQSCGADADLVALATSCLATDRRQRPRSARQVAEAVTGHIASIEGRARQAQLDAEAARVREAGQRRARWLTTALAAVVLALGVIVWGAFSITQQMRARNAAAATQRINDALNEAGVLLGQAQNAPIGDKASLVTLRAAGARLSTALAAETNIDPAVRARTEAFLGRLDNAARDRTLVESVEDAIIIGATHLDRQSWTRMTEQLRAALLSFGIDVRQPPTADVSERINASESAVQLVEAIEMWIGSEGQLGYFSVQNFPVEHLNRWVEVLHAADTNAFRTGQRRVYYAILNEYFKGGKPDPARRAEHLADLDALEASVEMAKATPRSLSWLATTYYLLNEPQRAADFYRRAIIAHPADFMLTFDYVFALESQAKWEEAIRYLMACVAMRPDVGGVWRKLGVAFREINLLQGSLDALQQSIRLQSDHAPTHIDLALTLQKLGRTDEAMRAADHAVHLDGQLSASHSTRGRLLQAAGDHRGALDAYRKAVEWRTHNPQWSEPVEQWINECERALGLPLTPTSQPGEASAAGHLECLTLNQKGTP